MADEYTGDVLYQPGSLGGDWVAKLYKNGKEVSRTRGYFKFYVRIWLWWEARSWRLAGARRVRNENRSMKGIKL